MATSLMQLLRDALLANSKLSVTEKLDLRASPMVRQAVLVDIKQALELMDLARQRTNDSNLSQAA